MTLQEQEIKLEQAMGVWGEKIARMTLSEKATKLKELRDELDELDGGRRGTAYVGGTFAAKGYQEYEEQMDGVQKSELCSEEFQIHLNGAEMSINYNLKKALEHLELLRLENA